MAEKKVSNQVMIPGLPDGQAGSICNTCGEQVVFKTPMPVDTFIEIADCFIKLHTLKGCNDENAPPFSYGQCECVRGQSGLIIKKCFKCETGPEGQ